MGALDAPAAPAAVPLPAFSPSTLATIPFAANATLTFPSAAPPAFAFSAKPPIAKAILPAVAT